MDFFMIGPRQGYASYHAAHSDQSVDDARIIPPYRRIATHLTEYLGVPPRKPGKRGNFHQSGSQYFVDAVAFDLFATASRGALESSEVGIEGREQARFRQVWVKNFVDCLDESKSICSPAGGFYQGKIGVIRKPAFDLGRWDGSSLFVVPQDPGYVLFCSGEFVEAWRGRGLKGICFSRFLMDPASIKS